MIAFAAGWAPLLSLSQWPHAAPTPRKMEPRSYSAAPVGTNFVLGGF